MHIKLHVMAQPMTEESMDPARLNKSIDLLSVVFIDLQYAETYQPADSDPRRQPKHLSEVHHRPQRRYARFFVFGYKAYRSSASFVGHFPSAPRGNERVISEA